jgi:predicted RNA-binding Zn-ribbon protein involved in translation (DUF1610 family)
LKKQTRKKQPRFFCDNCGAEVGGDTKACPSCGRFFVSVRCPACGFSGEERLFAGGCPACGYSTPPTGGKAPLHEKKISASPLPLWVYIFSIAALLCVFSILFFVLTK